MSRQASVDELNDGVNGALGMNQRADVIRRHIEETADFNNLKPVLIRVPEFIVMRLSSFQAGRWRACFTVK